MYEIELEKETIVVVCLSEFILTSYTIGSGVRSIDLIILLSAGSEGHSPIQSIVVVAIFLVFSAPSRVRNARMSTCANNSTSQEEKFGKLVENCTAYPPQVARQIFEEADWNGIFFRKSDWC